MYWRRIIPTRMHPPAEGYKLLSFTSLSQKGTTAPCSRLPASPGRELLPPTLVYQPLLEGRYYPLLSFTNYHQRGATTPCSRLPATTRRELLPPHLRLRPSAPLQTTFHQFSNWIKQLQHNPSLISKHPFPIASQNSQTTVTRISKITQTSEQICKISIIFEQPSVQISYALFFKQTHVYTRF